MATRALNFRMDEKEMLDLKKVASVFNISMTDLVKEAINEHVAKQKKDPFYRLTANVEEASEEETEEILKEIERLTDDDLSIVSVKHVTVGQIQLLWSIISRNGFNSVDRFLPVWSFLVYFTVLTCPFVFLDFAPTNAKKTNLLQI